VKRKNNHYFLLLLFPIILWLWNCRKPTLANWDTEMVIPLLNGTLKIDHFLGDSLFTSDANQVLNIDYNKKIFSIAPDSILKIRDTLVVNSFTNVFPFTIQPGQNITFLPPGETTFDIPYGAKLKKAIVRKGKLRLTFSNFVSQPIDIIYRIPSATLYGNPFEIKATVPSGSNTVTKEIDLKNYQIVLTGSAGVSYNSLYQTYTVGLNPNATATIVPTGTFAQIKAQYSGVVPEYIEGYFGNPVVSFGPDTIRLDIFKNLGVQNFSLSAAKTDFTILNYIGADFNGKISDFTAVKSTNTLALNYPPIKNININRATKANNTPISSVKNLSIDQNNSNITSFFSVLPDKIFFKGEIKCNPLGNTSGYQDFSYSGKGVDIFAHIQIPMKFNADAFFLSSDIELDLSGVRQLKNIRGGGLKFYIQNGYPFDVILQAYLLDSDKKILDSLLVPGQNKALSGQLNSMNEVVMPVSSLLYIPLSEEKTEQMQKSKYLRLKARLVMPPQPPPITIKSDYTIIVKIIADVVYNVTRK
jgi:hypothetical protein